MGFNLFRVSRAATPGILVGNTDDDNDDDEKMTMTTER